MPAFCVSNFLPVVFNWGAILSLRGHVALSGDIFGRHRWSRESAAGIWWVQLTDEMATGHRMALQSEDLHGSKCQWPLG